MKYEIEELLYLSLKYDTLGEDSHREIEEIHESNGEPLTEEELLHIQNLQKQGRQYHSWKKNTMRELYVADLKFENHRIFHGYVKNKTFNDIIDI